VGRCELLHCNVWETVGVRGTWPCESLFYHEVHEHCGVHSKIYPTVCPCYEYGGGKARSTQYKYLCQYQCLCLT
jgi:hypothetical protein